MWIARDKNGELWLHKEKTIKTYDQWSSMGDVELVSLVDKSIFSEVKWEDEEPRELVLKPINEE
ncbi:hypothetical protein [Bacteroides sp. An19]|uniref:hypothetical protein n=1 Tax=Bacteroides sp. An19 TaxID=1965580 RepID=UPI000B36B9EF|nr:hypothetical protein [Bacteroides sp. An19]OUP37237.1 hypothetical protein B5F25_00115 [Bacteroides sp. An19]